MEPFQGRRRLSVPQGQLQERPLAEPWEAQALRRGGGELPATWPGLSGQRAPLACAKPSLAPQILAAVVTTREVEAGLQGYYKFEFSLGHGGRPCVQRVCVSLSTFSTYPHSRARWRIA